MGNFKLLGFGGAARTVIMLYSEVGAIFDARHKDVLY